MADPVRNLQRSLMAGLLVTTVIYVLTNVAYAVVLDFDALSSSDAIASAFALKAWGEVASPAVPVAVSVSVFGMLCASFFGSSRLILAAARTGHLPRVLSLVTIETRVPLSCVLFKGVLGTLFLFFSSLEMLIQAVVFVDSLWDIVVVQSLVLLRSVVKERRQSYKVPLLVAVLRLASSISLVIMPLLSPTVYCQYLVILSVYAAGVLYYGVIVAAHFEIRASRSLLHFLQKLLLSVPCFDELTFMLQQTGCDNAKVGVQMDNAYSEPLCMHDAGSLEGASKDESGRNLCSEVGGTRYRHSALRRFVNSSEARKAHSNTTSETTRF